MAQYTILVIDDDEDIRRFLKRTLETAGGYIVLTAKNGKEGIKLARSNNPDLVLLDIMMPGLNGFEVLERLKSDYKTMSIPVILLSSETSEDAKIKGAYLYSDLYLTKPITREELLEKVGKVLKRK